MTTAAYIQALQMISIAALGIGLMGCIFLTVSGIRGIMRSDRERYK